MSSLFHCESCDRGYTSRLAAAECADVDRAEDEDRRNNRVFRAYD